MGKNCSAPKKTEVMVLCGKLNSATNIFNSAGDKVRQTDLRKNSTRFEKGVTEIDRLVPVL
jgi:hypothetical protein